MESIKYEFEFSIQSTHPGIAAPEYLEQINDALARLHEDPSELSGNQPLRIDILEATVVKQKTLPVGAIIVTIGMVLGTELAKEMVKKLADDLYLWLKKQCTGADITKVDK